MKTTQRTQRSVVSTARHARGTGTINNSTPLTQIVSVSYIVITRWYRQAVKYSRRRGTETRQQPESVRQVPMTFGHPSWRPPPWHRQSTVATSQVAMASTSHTLCHTTAPLLFQPVAAHSTRRHPTMQATIKPLSTILTTTSEHAGQQARKLQTSPAAQQPVASRCHTPLSHSGRRTCP